MSDVVIDLANDSETEDVIMVDDQPETSAPKEEKPSMDTNNPEDSVVNDPNLVEFVSINLQTKQTNVKFYLDHGHYEYDREMRFRCAPS